MIKSAPYHRLQGFTLLELSIVLVIIGLVIGGVVAGKELIESASKQKIIAEVAQYRTAILAFKLKYNALPGDMQNADDYWPTATAGNGNGQIHNAASEGYRFWDHLAKAGLISGSYTGASSGGGAVIGVNIPSSAYNKAGYSVYYGGITSTYTNNTTSHWFRYGREITGAINWGTVFSGMTAYPLDQKMDDGLPNSGEMVTINGSGGLITRCVTGSGSNWVYDMNDDRVECHSFFDMRVGK